MAKVCYKCKKRYMSGHNVSHSNRKTKRRFNPNLASRILDVDGTKKRVTICVRCLKSLHKVA